MIVLSTPRLHLRPVRGEDLDALVAFAADPRVMEAFGGPVPREATVAWLEKQLAHWQAHAFGRFVVWCGGELVGLVGLSRADFDAGMVPGVEIAWRFVFDHWGKGYATEAARAAIDDGFGRLGLDEIIGVTTPSNARSRRVMDRLGMIYSPTETFEHPLVPEGSPLRTHVIYRLKRPSP